MANGSLLAPFHQFLTDSNELLALAQAGEWEQFSEKMAVRPQALATLGDANLIDAIAEAGLADFLKESIEEIMVVNDEIEKVASQAKDSITKELSESFQMSKAISAYRS